MDYLKNKTKDVNLESDSENNSYIDTNNNDFQNQTVFNRSLIQLSSSDDEDDIDEEDDDDEEDEKDERKNDSENKKSNQAKLFTREDYHSHDNNADDDILTNNYNRAASKKIKIKRNRKSKLFHKKNKKQYSQETIKIHFDNDNRNLFQFEKDPDHIANVFDDAFRESVRKVCFVIKLKLSELKLILEALNIPVKPIIEYDSNHFIKLPLFHNNYLSYMISSTVNEKTLIQDNYLSQFLFPTEDNDYRFTISKENAILIKSQLIGLIEGSYWDIRGFIMQLCDKNNMYIPNQSNLFLVRNVCNCAIKGTIDRCGPCHQNQKIKTYFSKSCDFSGYYYVGRPSRWSPVIVMTFLKMLGITMRRLNLLKPLDGMQFLLADENSLKEMFLISSTLLNMRLLVYQQTLRYLEFVWCCKIRPFHSFKYCLFKDLLKINQNRYMKIIKKRRDKSKLIKDIRDEIFSEWGEIMFNKYIDVTNLVEIAHFDRLIRGYYACSKAYCWGISLIFFINFCTILREKTGYLLDKDVSKEFPEAKKDMKWVIVKGLIINEIIAYNLASNVTGSEDAISKLYDHEHKAVLIPLNCIRFINWRRTYVLMKDIRIGQVYSVVSYKSLLQIYETVDWFDQPDKGTLISVADGLVEIISIIELQSHARVGIRILSNNKCDAILIKALLHIVDNDSVNKKSEGNPSIFDKDVPRRKYSCASKYEGSITITVDQKRDINQSYYFDTELFIVLLQNEKSKSEGNHTKKSFDSNPIKHVIIIKTPTVIPNRPKSPTKIIREHEDLSLRPPFIIKHVCTCMHPCNDECKITKRHTSPTRPITPSELTNLITVESIPITRPISPIIRPISPIQTKKYINPQRKFYEAKALDEKLTKAFVDMEPTNTMDILLNRTFDNIQLIDQDWDNIAREYLKAEKEKDLKKENPVAKRLKVTI